MESYLSDDAYRNLQRTLAALHQAGVTAAQSLAPIQQATRQAVEAVDRLKAVPLPSVGIYHTNPRSYHMPVGDFAQISTQEAELLRERDLLRIQLECSQEQLRQEQARRGQVEELLTKARNYEGAYYALKRACFLFLQLPNTRPEERFDWRQFEADGWSKN